MDKQTDFSVAVSAHNPQVTVLKIRGFMDVNAAPLFERELENLMRQGRHRILVDLTEVSYISSAGIGIFVGMLSQARSQPGGDIKVFGASPKIFKVFQAIGLDVMMDFLSDEANVQSWGSPPVPVETLERFQIFLPREIFCGREFNLKVEARDAQDQLLTHYHGTPKVIVNSGLVLPHELNGFKNGVWEGRAVLTDSGPLTLLLVDAGRESRLNLFVKEESGKAGFPLLLVCKTCGRTAQVKGMDIYRCAYCNEIFFVDAWGHAITLKTGSQARRLKSKYKGMELKINSDVNYLNSIRKLIQGVCEQEGLDEVTTNAVTLTTEEALLNIIEHGNDFDPWQMIAVRLHFQKKQLTVRIRDYGDPYDITQHKTVSVKACIQKGMKGGVGGVLINQLMDKVNYRSGRNFNQLTLVKRYPPVSRAARTIRQPSA